MMLDDIVGAMEEKMQKTLDVFRKDLGAIRAGAASPGMVEKISVDYYGTATPINQMANIAVAEPRVLTIQPWDKSTMAAIEKAILKSDLGITPANDGVVIRLVVPQLTSERRQEIVKSVKKKAEEAKVALRNIRRDAVETMKKAEKDKQLTEDDAKKGQEKVQKQTDKYVKDVDTSQEAKEKEIAEV